eukprot:TRINITY_DN81198_c0_g1_i1.p1 TRINITY_DN81198_c0_g1~~TRINITY_DN81198_c0_g1_i1.p1  ORF type:complete len:398 (-),score=79.35 TRINITY_DN81198_c0_g1_i1:113-1306(-)
MDAIHAIQLRGICHRFFELRVEPALEALEDSQKRLEAELKELRTPAANGGVLTRPAGCGGDVVSKCRAEDGHRHAAECEGLVTRAEFDALAWRLEDKVQNMTCTGGKNGHSNASGASKLSDLEDLAMKCAASACKALEKSLAERIRSLHENLQLKADANTAATVAQVERVVETVERKAKQQRELADRVSQKADFTWAEARLETMMQEVKKLSEEAEQKTRLSEDMKSFTRQLEALTATVDRKASPVPHTPPSLPPTPQAAANGFPHLAGPGMMPMPAPQVPMPMEQPTLVYWMPMPGPGPFDQGGCHGVCGPQMADCLSMGPFCMPQDSPPQWKPPPIEAEPVPQRQTPQHQPSQRQSASDGWAAVTGPPPSSVPPEPPVTASHPGVNGLPPSSPWY